MQLNEPLPGEKPTSTQLQKEADDFMAFMGAAKAGRI